MPITCQNCRREETNLKVTTPVDLAIAEFILKQRFTQ
ncbi:hypothetical protein CY0110_09480, partial [Crocosphaera chwakensis CCY0110]